MARDESPDESPDERNTSHLSLYPGVKKRIAFFVDWEIDI
jgi:hypothetical protein